MSISAIVCTRDRPNLIGGCLDALSRNRCDGLEILVVDQSSDSSTRELVSAAAATDRRIRYHHSATTGLSRARNFGIRQSKGEIVAFTDDDCIPDTGWISALVEEFESNPDISAVYGRSIPAEPAAPGERPVAVKLDTKRRVFSGACDPWRLGHGNNMAFRRSVFDAVGYFDEALGPGGALRNCDDADFTYRLLKAGLTAVYSPEPIVYHRQFRHGEDRWQLERDYGIGSGAFYSKHLRCGDLYALRLILDRWFRGGILHFGYGIITGRPAHIRTGWYRIAYSALGLLAARKVRVNPLQRVFMDSTAGGHG